MTHVLTIPLLAVLWGPVPQAGTAQFGAGLAFRNETARPTTVEMRPAVDGACAKAPPATQTVSTVVQAGAAWHVRLVGGVCWRSTRATKASASAWSAWRMISIKEGEAREVAL